MTDTLKRQAWLWFALVVTFCLLGARGLNEPDEGRYAEIAREMLADGDWLMPHMNGIPHVQKPPLIYWFTAVSLAAFGREEWAARLPSALAAIGVVILIFLLAKRLFGDRNPAVAAALVLTTTGGFFAGSQLLTPDMLMTFWIVAAITAAIHRHPWWFFLFMGLGFLTKGPMALVVPICAVVGWQWGTPPLVRSPMPWARGMLLALGISLSWFVVLSIRDPELFRYFFQNELVERFGSTSHGRSKPFWFFLLVLPAGLLPWIFLLPWRGIWQRLRSGRRPDARQGLLVGWVVPPLVVLSLSGSKLPTYILPLLPAFALLVAGVSIPLRRIWSIAVPTALVLLLGILYLSRHEGLLGVQASSRLLVEALERQEPDAGNTILFACEVRVEGLSFYANRLIHITRNEADIVLIPTAAQSVRLYDSVTDCVKTLTDGPPAHGVMKTSGFQKSFDQEKWRIIATSGAYSLIANHPPHPRP